MLYVSHSFFLMLILFSIVWIHHTSSIHKLVVSRLGLRTFVCKSLTMFFLIFFISLWYISRTGIAKSYVKCICN